MRLTILAITLVAAGILSASPVEACTNFLITKGATVDGSTLITYTADSHTLYGELHFQPARENPPGAMLDIYEWDTGTYVGQIKDAPRTYSVIGNMNEHQVSVGETTFGGRPELIDPVGGIDYGQMMYVGLQRSRTAREAIQVMTSLAEEYGYRSEGESISVADPNEAWILEMVGKGPGGKGALWAARRIPDGYVSAHANQSRIRSFPLHDPQNCLYGKDVIAYARKKGYFKGKDEDFSFAETYNPLTCEALRFCEIRVWRVFTRVAPSLKLKPDYVKCVDGAEPLPLWVKPDRKLSVRDAIDLMRDHFEGTEFDLSKGVGAGPYSLPYRWRPLTWEVDGVKYLNERAASTQQTGFSFVAQARASLPDPIGGVLWFSVDDTSSTVYVPMYCGLTRAPRNYAAGKLDYLPGPQIPAGQENSSTVAADFYHFSWDSAFWVFNWVANFAYSRYSEMIVDIRKVQGELEGDFFSQQPGVEAAALKLYREAPDQGREYLTRYSEGQAERTVARWRKLGEELLVKYLDGNLKDEHGHVSHPGYPEEWYRRMVKDSGEALKVRKLKNEYEPEENLATNGFFHSREELGSAAAHVPADFPFDKEKLFLLPGTDKCGQPPNCCLTPVFDQAKGKLKIEPPKSAPNKCGAPGWLVRIPKDEKRPIIRKAEEP